MGRVVHFKKEACDVYIGRPSIYGNPFEIGVDGNRINPNWGYFVSGATINSESYRKMKREGVFNE